QRCGGVSSVPWLKLRVRGRGSEGSAVVPGGHWHWTREDTGPSPTTRRRSPRPETQAGRSERSELNGPLLLCTVCTKAEEHYPVRDSLGFAGGAQTRQRRQHANTPTVGTGDTGEDEKREATSPSMFVFGSAAKADADGDDGGGRGKASSTTATDGAPSFVFDASFLPAVTATATNNDDDAPAAAGEFKFNVLPPQPAAAATEGGESGDTKPTPLFGSTFKSRQEVGAACVKSQTKHEEAMDGGPGEQGAPIAMHCSAASSGCLLREPVTQEELMNSGHELHEGYTCPLCCLSIALPVTKHSVFMSCCMKTVCNGCLLAWGDTCAFCRTPLSSGSDAGIIARVRKRVDANDPVAIQRLASAYYHGNWGLQQDVPRAIELWTEAARLGDLNAHYKLGHRYYDGDGVEQDVARGVRHFQYAAMQGHPDSRFELGCIEYDSGNHELAVRHWMVSAKMGQQGSLNEIKDMFMKGHATKAQYAEALESYQNALEETKSPQREEAFFDGSD
ncbi:hypothetical protein THAOC_37619, partial [Thalassiosira oceanica]